MTNRIPTLFFYIRAGRNGKGIEMHFCLVVIEQQKIYALTFRVKHGTVTDSVFINDLSSLSYTSFDHVIFTGFFPGVIRRELEIPRQVGRRELPFSVQYKFVQNLPMDPNDVWWEYWVSNFNDSKLEYKICAASVEKNEFIKQLDLLNQNNIKIDKCILSSLLISSDIFPGIEKYGPPTPENFLAYMQQEKTDEYDKFVLSLGDDISLSAKSAFWVLLAFIKNGGCVDSVAMCDGMIPRDFQPVRYKFLRKINLILMLFAVIFASVVLVERSNRSYTHYEMIERQNSELREELKELQSRNLLLGTEEKLLKEYRDLNAGYGNLEDAILEATQKIPSYMWAKALRLSGNTLEITLESSKDDVNFYNTMKAGKLYELKNLRKNKIRGENYDYTVTLELLKK